MNTQAQLNNTQLYVQDLIRNAFYQYKQGHSTLSETLREFFYLVEAISDHDKAQLATDRLKARLIK